MKNSPFFIFSIVSINILVIFAAGKGAVNEELAVVKTPPQEGANKHYVSNRQPLVSSPLVKLPIGSIQPKAWLSLNGPWKISTLVVEFSGPRSRHPKSIFSG